MRRFVTVAWVCLVFAGLGWRSSAVAASEGEASKLAAPRQDIWELNAAVGIKALFNVGWGFLPAPITVVLNADILRHLRIHGEFTYQMVEGVKRGSTGLGGVFTPVGKYAMQENVGFQLKVPVLFEIGLLKGETEAGDSYTDYNNWLMLGPSTGLDLTWWFKGKAGFRASFNVGYMFRVDLGSRYEDGYSYNQDDIGTLEAAALLGVVI